MAVKLTRSRRLQTCPVCTATDCTCPGENPYEGKGEKAIVLNLDGISRVRLSNVIAPERIYENGRLLYAKGAHVRAEDLERLGLAPAPAPESEQEKPAPKPRAKTSEKKSPARGARGHRKKEGA